ncbi:FkbM family methyltransferase [Flavobacterium urocaniciphilum]|uniref:Methyltransferase, FkbM family n=1 Tax=Flavobacterium urocaniciphilum TaxID=1299341 RepID=A0A1H9DG62_9FLAO|nr:FkbM family methyltransferase [Flavobacterium urocaniciphilum]SEQ12464.1 methyltransferase, FkbM family [Flavobacterium urocaniciphilum]
MEISINNIILNIATGKHQELYEHINSGLWEPYTFEIFDYFTDENQNTIDLGCWNGITTLYLAHKSNKVFAIDPDNNCFSELIKNIGLNPEIKAKIKPIKKAISNVNGVTNLFAREKYGESSSSILERKRDLLTTDQIETITFEKLIHDNNIANTSFIKIDIEGAEFLILPTLESTLSKLNYPTLYVSFHYNYLNENLYAKFIQSRFLTKVILKIEHIFKINFLKNKIDKKLKNLFNGFSKYQFIYTHKGDMISQTDLVENPSLIKHNELIFTNKKWLR